MTVPRIAAVCALLVGTGLGVPPPFGAVINQWDLPMSGSYVTAGITWRPDSGRLYIIDEMSSGYQAKVRSCRPDDPVATLRDENWQFPSFGSSTKDLPQGIAWDADSGCFWTSIHVDGSSSSCVLARMTPQGTWTGDSWLVTRGDFLCLYGIEKSPDVGVFYGGGSWTAENGLCAFDPYRRQILGRIVKGYSYGAACVPADSNYVVTAMSGRYLKIDYWGAVLDSVYCSSHSPWDMTLMIPDAPGTEDTVCFYSMCQSSGNTLVRVSAGMTWLQLLAGNRHNVRPSVIICPSGAVDSGQNVTPRFVVRNVGNEAADRVRVWFKIDHYGNGKYLDSTEIINMPPHSMDTVSLSPWNANGRDSMSGIVWVFWAADSVHRDDTMRNRFLVRARDVRIARISAPRDTIDSGLVITPQAYVWNHGNAPEQFDVVFRIRGWCCTTRVSVGPGGARYVDAGRTYVTLPYAYVPVVTAVLPGDLHPENNICRDTFWVRGTAQYDVEVSGIIAPGWAVDTLMSVTPTARMRNRGSGGANFDASFIVRDPSGLPVYEQSTSLVLGAGVDSAVEFPPARFRSPGQYSMTCSTCYAPDQNEPNDYVTLPLLVRVGVEEPQPAGAAAKLLVLPNPATRCRVVLQHAIPHVGPARLVFCDVTGRVVARRELGVMDEGRTIVDLGELGTGVYGVRLEATGRAFSTRLVIQR